MQVKQKFFSFMFCTTNCSAINFFQKRKTSIYWGLLAVVLVVYFAFGFHHLVEFVSFDEHYWLYSVDSDRIHAYWNAIAEHDWKDTRINDKPGITLAYVSGIGMLFEKNPQDQVIEKFEKSKIYNPEKTKSINFKYRTPILVLSGLFSLFFFWIIRKLTKKSWLALIATSLILLSPILLGMSQIVNPDSLFWVFGFSSLLSFLTFIKFQEKKFAFLTSLFLGLSLASKYVSVIFFPMFFFMLIVFYLFKYKEIKKDLSVRIIQNSLYYILILFGGMALFAILMPASFVEPKYFYDGTIGYPGMEPIFWTIMIFNLAMFLDAYFWKAKINHFIFEKIQPLKKYIPPILYTILSTSFIFVLWNWMSKQGIIEWNDIPFDFKRKGEFGEEFFIKRFVLEQLPLIFSLQPFVLFSLLYLWIKSIFKTPPFPYTTFVLSSFVFIFWLAVIEQGLLVTIRYSIILYPICFTLASIGIYDFFREKAWDKKEKWIINILSFIISSVLILLSALALTQDYFSAVYRRKFEDLFYDWQISLPILIIIAFALTAGVRWILSKNLWKKVPKIWVFLSIVLISVLHIFLIRPFYFNFTSYLLPKREIITAAWGYGGYEAAQYLNSLPDSKNLIVWSDSHGVCEFFSGECSHASKVDIEKLPIDYYVFSLQGQLNPNFPHKREGVPVWSLAIDERGKNYIKIYKAVPQNNYVLPEK